MGSYLSEPITEKVSTDELNDKLICGASSMQGWRLSQEDAHNCLLNYDTDTAFFAVYDGHGGHEVAQYCSEKLPDFIKQTEAYKEGNIEKALVDGFLKFDATIATKEVLDYLRELAGDKEAEVESDEEENLSNLYEEAAMPIERVIEKYTSVNPALKNLKVDGNKIVKSPYLKAKKDKSDGASSSSEVGSSKPDSGSGQSSSDNSNAEAVSSSNVESSDKGEAEESCDKDSETNGSTVLNVAEAPPASSEKESKTVDSTTEDEIDEVEAETPSQNGVTSSDTKTEPTPPQSPTQENGEVLKKGKGKALTKTKGVETPKPESEEEAAKPQNQRSKRHLQNIYNKLLSFDDDSSDDDEDDEDTSVNIEEGNSDSSAEDEEDDDEEEGEEEEDEEDDDDDDGITDDADLKFARNMKEDPGYDSGCTAVVALLKGNELYVANAGDSRCIVCRKGKAIEMSLDHKPEDEPERDRVVKAGGFVSSDGRVNGGLNLSRAVGDRNYKQNKDLTDKEQMITALPDVEKLIINPEEDEFMVLACDGIWNFMSSQEVVDFVRPKIQEHPEKLSQICEEMFEHCLAPTTLGDGTGCDNMTAIIVRFKTAGSNKRRSSTESAESESKRVKTETTA